MVDLEPSLEYAELSYKAYEGKTKMMLFSSRFIITVTEYYLWIPLK